METRSRTRLKLRGAAVLAALGALVVPATAGAKVHTHTPVIKKVTPHTANIGDKLVIRGKYFRRGRGKNRVLFKRSGGRSVFIKAGVSTTRRMSLVLPKRLEKYMAQPGGHPAATRFRLRVLTKKLSRRFTTGKNSPLIGPKQPKAPPITPAPPEGDCDGDGLTNNVDTDDDNDLLPDTQEATLKLDPCSGDSDGDGVEDGYEYQSALDLNNDDYRTASKIIPYPGKRPYPNPLYKDAGSDYDGDGLTLGDEYALWKYVGNRTLSPLSYSDGTRYSLSTLDVSTGRRSNFTSDASYLPAQNFATWATLNGYATVHLFTPNDPARPEAPFSLFDLDRSGGAPTAGETYYWLEADDNKISDDERDEDADGLTNLDELHSRMTPEYWAGCYSDEKPYPIAYSGTSATDPDSDGDGILDGADDQDHDDVPNIMELSRFMASHRVDWDHQCHAATGKSPAFGPDEGFVNPFNPCLPDRFSRSCEQHPGLDGDAYPPYDDNGGKYLSLN